MRSDGAGRLSRGHLARRGTPVFGFDVQERLLRRGVVGDAGLQRQPDALLDGGLRERASRRHALVHRPQRLHRRGQAHAPRLLRVAVRERLLGLHRRGRQALAASLPRADRGRFRRRAGRTDALLPGLVEPVCSTEFIRDFPLVLRHCRKTHTPGLLRRVQQRGGREGLPVLDRWCPNRPARGRVGGAKARGCRLLSSARCGRLLLPIDRVRLQRQRER